MRGSTAIASAKLFLRSASLFRCFSRDETPFSRTLRVFRLWTQLGQSIKVSNSAMTGLAGEGDALAEEEDGDRALRGEPSSGEPVDDSSAVRFFCNEELDAAAPDGVEMQEGSKVLATCS